MSGHENAPALMVQRAGRGCLGGSSGTSGITQLCAGRQFHDWRIHLPAGETRAVRLSDRPAWLMDHLAEVASKGLTAPTATAVLPERFIKH
jgi:hypothetical protein